MTESRLHGFKGFHDPFNPKDLPPLSKMRSGVEFPNKVGGRHLVELVAHWYATDGQYEIPRDLVERAVRYTLAALRYFVDRNRVVELKGMGRIHRLLITNRKGRHPGTGEVFPIPPYAEVRWKASDDWIDDLTYAEYGRPRRKKGLHRARQRYYLTKLAEQGLLSPDISDRALAKLGITRKQLLKYIKQRTQGRGTAPR